MYLSGTLVISCKTKSALVIELGAHTRYVILMTPQSRTLVMFPTQSWFKELFGGYFHTRKGQSFVFNKHKCLLIATYST